MEQNKPHIDEIFLKNISERIEEICKERGIDAKTFANQTGVSQSTIQRYVAAERHPGFSFLFGVLSLGYSIDWLITGQGSMYLKPEMVTLTPVAPKALPAPAPNHGEPQNDDDLIVGLIRLLYRRLDPDLQAAALPVLELLSDEKKD